MAALLQLLAFLESLGANSGPIITAIQAWVTATEALYAAIVAILPKPAPAPLPKFDLAMLTATERSNLETRVSALFGGVVGGPLANLLALLIQYAPQLIALLQSLGILPKPTPATNP